MIGCSNLSGVAKRKNIIFPRVELYRLRYSDLEEKNRRRRYSTEENRIEISYRRSVLPIGSLDDERTEPAEAGFFTIVKNWRAGKICGCSSGRHFDTMVDIVVQSCMLYSKMEATYEVVGKNIQENNLSRDEDNWNEFGNR